MYNPDEVVIDPEVPEAVKGRLRLVPATVLIRFAASAPPLAEQRRQPERTPTGGAARMEKENKASSFMDILHDRWNRRALISELSTGSVPRAVQRAASAYHRRYVVPRLDFDLEAWELWERTVNAVEKITQSGVVKRQVIDSVHVAAVLPHHQWEIAERLARLSALRATHSDILRGVKTDHPDVAAVLKPQRRAHKLAIEDVKQRLGNLEVFANRVQEADAARRREEAVRQLSELNDSHLDLVAGLGHSGSEMELADHAAREVQAVIDQANEAVKQANEAGRILVLPGDS